MKKRLFGFAVWLALAACLYFFENNGGTRAVLLCTLLVPLIPALRKAFFMPDGEEEPKAPEALTVKSFAPREADEPGDVRPYQPGDPAGRIHWKLSVKTGTLFVRETAAAREDIPEERKAGAPLNGEEKKVRLRAAPLCAAGMLLSAALLFIIPEARRGAQALCNRLFAASEAANAYAYEYFPVPDGQSVGLAALLAGCFGMLLLTLTALLRGRAAALVLMAACTLFQAYFGLSFPAWVNVPLYGALAVKMMRRPLTRGSLRTFGAVLLLASAFTWLFLPGVDAATETASETVRDRLSQLSRQIAGPAAETGAGETEARHAHTLSLKTGGQEARTEREYRLVTAEEEQISMPHWVDYLRIILLLLLTVALVSLPFAPFLVLNARRRKALEARKAFSSENTGEAVCAVFRQIIAWLEAAGIGAGNLPYREWAETLAEAMPEGYPARFSRCAADFEEAAYSAHVLPEDRRGVALELLKETENTLWEKAGWKQRFRLKYWMCLRE